MTLQTKLMVASLLLFGGFTAAYLTRQPELPKKPETSPPPGNNVVLRSPPAPVPSSGNNYGWPAGVGPVGSPGPIGYSVPPGALGPTRDAPSGMTALPSANARPQQAPVYPKITLEWDAQAAEKKTLGFLKHRVRDGETLSSIARQYLGSADRYRDVFDANRGQLVSPNRLRTGMELVIPLTGNEPAIVSVPPPATEPRHERNVHRSVSSPTPGSDTIWHESRPEHRGLRTYTARSDDTLGGIARQFYGDPREYHRLLEANSDRLRSPDDLRPGMILTIP